MVADGEMLSGQAGRNMAAVESPEDVAKPASRGFDHEFRRAKGSEYNKKHGGTWPEQGSQAAGEGVEIGHAIECREVGVGAVEGGFPHAGPERTQLFRSNQFRTIGTEAGRCGRNHARRRVGQQDVPSAFREPGGIETRAAADVDHPGPGRERAQQFAAHGAPLRGNAEPRGEALVEGVRGGVKGPCSGRQAAEFKR